ncbi:extracellular solute-binding protein [Saxibacter everestensis]|uniref:Extracellular solute-binding protein n=1 Tax=Saxibacter everestensis TaxID=2909229 RepID=A0ABY8QR38_9MICO|nr:extracellular solute-binding protein [Brevibacteriaceae bacterium ZFBP1038]
MRTAATRRRLGLGALGAIASLAVALGVAGCVPGSSGGSGPKESATQVKDVPDPAQAGDVTLRVWDQEVRGGQDKTLKALNAAFEKKYPNIKIERTSRSFSDLRTTLKLAISDDNPPDVVQANQGYGSMVSFAQADLLRPMDDYATVFGWEDRFPKPLLDLNRVSADKKSFGSGNLYGLSQAGEYIGIYFNKDILKKAGVAEPKTWEEFLASMPALKAKGELPVQFGNLDKYPAIHTFGALQANAGNPQDIRDTIYGSGPGFETDQTTSAAQTLASWAKDGYIPESANGLGYDDAAKQFADGKGAYLITGTWELPEVEPTLGDKLGFMPPPAKDGAAGPVTTGGEGLAWSITSKSKHDDVAAAYIDFISNAEAADVMTTNGILPIVPGKEAEKLPEGSPQAAMFAGWKQLSENDGLVPYLDYSSPSFFDTSSEQLQLLIDGRVGPDEFAKNLNKDYRDFQDGNK